MILQELDAHIASVRIRFRGGAPTLPAPRPIAAAPASDEGSIGILNALSGARRQELDIGATSS